MFSGCNVRKVEWPCSKINFTRQVKCCIVLQCSIISHYLQVSLQEFGITGENYWVTETKKTHIPKCHKVLGDCRSDIKRVKNCIKEKKKEELVVSKTNTVINPRTMMIHFQNTPENKSEKQKLQSAQRKS